jgi:O-antigen/teichoic acid export membrane protein
MSLARNTLIIFLMRLSNLGLMMVGPILVARLLSVDGFGIYREFLVYASLLTTIAAFSFAQSLQYFVPTYPGHAWQLVRQTVILTALASIVVGVVVGVADWALHGQILGTAGLKVLLYTALCVNVDFWEFYWLAQQRPTAAFAYTSGRLISRLLIVICMAALSHSAQVIIAALMLFEAARIVLALVAWRLLRQHEAAKQEGLWNAQLRFCVPLGLAQIMGTFNTNIGSVLIARTISAATLAQYTVATYALPVLYMLRNSLSDALLPHMARAHAGRSGEPSLDLWHRANTLFAILLVPVALLLARYAELIVVTLFSDRYLPAVLPFQVSMFYVLTFTVDFGVAFRLLERTSAFLRSNLIGTLVNVALLALLLPRLGMYGAIAALTLEDLTVRLYLGRVLARHIDSTLAAVLGLRSLGRVLIAALAALPLLALPVSPGWRDIPLAAASSLVYLSAYAAVLWLIGTVEVRVLLRDGGRRALTILRQRGLPGAVKRQQ